MPELPEVEHLRLGLVPRLVGRTVRSVRILRRDIVTGPEDPPSGFSRSRAGPRPARPAGSLLLAGGRIAELRRLGKQLGIIAADGRAICVHLGMTGGLTVEAPGRPGATDPHRHIVWSLDDGSRLVFRDPRRFGGVWAFPRVDDLVAKRWASLGPDALSIESADLVAALRGSRRAIKAALLDQTVIAGVGNIYADEALFAAGISPRLRAGRLSLERAVILVREIRRAMLASIRAGGSTLRDYRDAEGRPGTNQTRFAVYGRGGEPCPSCGRTLTLLRLAGRATVMCRSCQR